MFQPDLLKGKRILVTGGGTGLTDTARVREQGGSAKRLKLARDHSVEIPVRVPAQEMAWWTIE